MFFFSLFVLFFNFLNEFILNILLGLEVIWFSLERLIFFFMLSMKIVDFLF